MMQTFRISDALRCILLNAPRGQNWACPKESVGAQSRQVGMSLLLRNTKLWKETLAQRQDRVTLAWWDGVHLGALASAKPRAGSRVWEVDHLYLPTNAAASMKFTPNLELLEHLVQAVGQRHAERIFLRVPSGSPAIDLARRVGFFPYFEETLLERKGGEVQAKDYPQITQIGQINDLGESAESVDEGVLPVSLEERRPEDDYGLFQLFSAATPSQVRVALGLTFDQWKDARERASRGNPPIAPFAKGGQGGFLLVKGGLGGIWSKERREWVARRGVGPYDHTDGKITGWLSLLPGSQAVEGEVMVHPDYPDLLAALMALALAKGGAQRWLVPDYQESVSDLLRYHSFQEVAYYTMLVKTVAARVTSHRMIPVEA